jgi:hypothetical protein
MPAGRRIHGIPVTKIPSARIQSSYGPLRWLTAFAAAIFVVGSAWGASPIPSVSSDEAISVEQIEAAIAAVEAREGLDEETRSKVVDQLRDAQAQLQNTKAAQAAAASFADAIQTAPAETEKLRKRLNQGSAPAPTAASLGIGESTPLPELEQALATKLAEIAAAEAKLADLESQLATQTDRPAKARKRINELRNGMDEPNRSWRHRPIGQPKRAKESTSCAMAWTSLRQPSRPSHRLASPSCSPTPAGLLRD